MIKKIFLAITLNLLLLTFFISPAFADQGIVFDDGGVSSAPVPVAVLNSQAAPADNYFSTSSGAEAASINLDATAAANGYSLISADNNFTAAFPPKSLIAAAEINTSLVTDDLPTPWKLVKISPTYQLDVITSAVYDNKFPIALTIKYSGDVSHYKRIYFYDKNLQSWRELPTIDNPSNNTVSANVFLPYVQVAVFSDPAIDVVGKSSWYSYKKGNFAASVDFPKGSRLRVYNTDNNKTVDITINDFGPERDKFPDRILDLDKVAFSKIASKGAGVINIRVQPLYVAPDAQGRVLGVSEEGAMAEPDLKATSAIAIDENTGSVLWEKNADAVLQLASLSKLIAIKVFLDQNPSLSTVVTYKKQDELYNYQYCSQAESARLTVKDGDKLTVGDLVYSALVASANNAVESLVRVSGLPRNVFIAKMNSYTASIGATSTHFVEPTGLSPQNVSTAREYAIITRDVFKNPLIQRISVTPKYVFTTINTKKKHTLVNTNSFIRDGVFAAANELKITGSKTGYLDKHNLMTRVAGDKGREVIAVDFGADTGLQTLTDIQELIQYGLKKLQ
jgi:D-alanyl-D-alanine endopeptidase (penicillin-binding protein 7)